MATKKKTATKKSVSKTATKKKAVKKAASKKSATAKKAAAKKAVKKTVVKKAATKKAAVKKKVAKKAAPAKKAASKKTATKKTIPVPASASEKPATITGKIDEVVIRMYCHGFGDCFLLSFMSKEVAVYRMLIDCGMLTGDTNRLKECIKNIKKDCGNHLDLVVQTHEHKDHISGFNLKGDDQKLLWDSINVDNVWLAWTENIASGGDQFAIDLKDKFNKKKFALAKALGLYNKSIAGPPNKVSMDTDYREPDYRPAQQRYASALQQLLNFYDIGPDDVTKSLKAKGELGVLTMKDAMGYFVQKNKDKGTPHINFWNPGDAADAETTGLTGIKFYFLGPPKNYDLLRKMDDKEHVEMYLSDMGLSDNFYMALTESDGEEISPFQVKYCMNKSNLTPEEEKDPEHVWNLYHQKKNEWRSIATDWLQNAGTLALNLDSYTNNTSLAMAIEFEDSGKVLLFPADAQIGNWISWTEPKEEGGTEPKLQWNDASGKKVTAADLLKRTVFYKVGHHASHNATAKKHGMELMTSAELAAMITVDEEVAKRQGKKGWKMPAEDLYQRLQEKTRGRIIRLDKGNLLKNGVEEIADAAKPTQQQRQLFNSCVKESELLVESDDGVKRPMYWEYRIKG